MNSVDNNTSRFRIIKNVSMGRPRSSNNGVLKLVREQ